MTLNNKILTLPSEQLSWLNLIKNIFKNTIISKPKNNNELLLAIKNRANKRGYKEFNTLLNLRDIEDYIKN